MRLLFIILLSVFLVSLAFSTSSAHDDSHYHHHGGCDHSHHHQHHHYQDVSQSSRRKLPEEWAEEEDMKLYGFPSHHDHHHHDHRYDLNLKLSGLGLWIRALGCSFLVSLASLVCLIILPLIFIQGKPSKAVVDALALFGAGAMLGDAFLHQLPHAFGGEHSHSHDHHSHAEHAHDHLPSHSHSLKDLSVGLSILAGIVLFLLVEKVVRYVEENSSGANSWSHGHHHHHHHHNSNKKLKDADIREKSRSKSSKKKEAKLSDGTSEEYVNGDNAAESLRKRKNVVNDEGEDLDKDAANGSSGSVEPLNRNETSQSPSNLVFGYLNLFSDGVHNFTDGMALGSAFLLYGSVGGWSRTLFLLAHELPQEIGDFGILVRSGFSISKALFFNFLSALMALAGTALALLWGQDPGQSSLIEGFTAGGFIYIAVAGVLAEMNNGKTYVRNTIVHLISLIMGMAVALCISLVE